MSLGDLATSGARDDDSGPLSDRLSLGVAARLSRYLQVLTQARKMGKETISSQELSEYTHVNSTQIRRDLSGFGKFGKQNTALVGAAPLGRVLASRDIFPAKGFNVVGISSTAPAKIGERIGAVS